MSNTPRDVFLYLLSIIALVASAISFGILLFELINVFIPDVLMGSYYSLSGRFNSMRSALAALVIILPVFLWVSWFLKKDISKFPEKRELKIRRWLLYLTLFVAALVIIGDLVALVRNFLEGELSKRFVLKVLAILFIAGSVFVHYLVELREKKKGLKWPVIFDSAVITAVTVGIIIGFYVAGSPQSQRLVRLDETRINDLQQIQWQAVNYWQKKEVLPASLDDLADPLSGYMVPRDPETGQSYEYRVLEGLKFEICSVFDTSSLETSSNPKKITRHMPAIDGDSWFHASGRVCFERTIDPDLYPVIKEKPSRI